MLLRLNDDPVQIEAGTERLPDVPFTVTVAVTAVPHPVLYVMVAGVPLVFAIPVTFAVALIVAAVTGDILHTPPVGVEANAAVVAPTQTDDAPPVIAVGPLLPTASGTLTAHPPVLMV